MVPLNGLAYEALFGKTPRIGGRFFPQWKDGNSFTQPGYERVSGQAFTKAVLSGENDVQVPLVIAE